MWNLPNDFRSDFLPPVTGCTSIFDEIARRTVNFISDCLSSNCNLVRFISNHATFYERSKSFLGRNAVFCCLRYGLYFRHLFASKHRRQFIDSWSRSQLKVNDFFIFESRHRNRDDQRWHGNKTKSVMESNRFKGMSECYFCMQS
jgi:hypothetical protein